MVEIVGEAFQYQKWRRELCNQLFFTEVEDSTDVQDRYKMMDDPGMLTYEIKRKNPLPGAQAVYLNRSCST